MKWPKTTPTGHTYVEPRTYAELLHEHSNAAQAAIECWEEDECPPEPTWEMVGIAHREVERLQRERDEAKAARREAWEHLDKAAGRVAHEQARAEAAEARTAPAVTHNDIEKVIDEWKLTGQSRGATLADDLWALLSGSDPAVYVVRESDLPEAERDEDGDWIVDGGFIAASQTTAETVRGWIPAYLRSATCLEAVARAIEAEQAVDSVEEKAIELHQVAYGGRIGFGHATLNAQEMFRSLARHVLGQEADQ